MKTILTAMLMMSSVLAGYGNDEPLLPDGVNKIFGRIRPDMSETQLQKIIGEYFPDATVVVGRWSGQTGYADAKVSARFSISIAEYNAPNDFDSRFIHKDLTMYVYDWETKRRINLSVYDWEDGQKVETRAGQ